MKKILFFGAMVALLLGTAACSSDMEPSMGDDMVRFTIELPGNIDSRAISDGTTAKKLTVAVYDDQGNELPAIRVNKDIPHQTTVEFKLVKGQTYSFAFWAQAEGAPYTFDTTNKTVNVSYEGAKSNDETRDAFYAYRADLTVTGPMSETIYLKRPFCQLNYGASDYNDAIKAGVNAVTSAVTVDHAATAFNLATGETSGDQAVTFTKEVLPSDPKTLTVEDKTYQWMAMNYFLVPSNEAVITTTLKLYEENATDPVRDLTVYSVPVQKNHRTNIVGNLFTEDVNFNVIIDERFDQPDYNVVLWDGHSTETPAYDEATQTWTISNPNQLAGFAKQVSEGKTFAGETVVLANDINLNDKTWTPIGWVTTYGDSKSFKGTFDGQGHAINNFRINYRNYGSGLFFRVDGGATIKNLNVDQAFVTGYDSGNVVGIVAGYAYQTVTFENITVTNSLVSGFGKVGAIIGMAADPAGGNTTVKNCTVKNNRICGTYNVGGLIGLMQGVCNDDIQTTNTVEGNQWNLWGNSADYVTFDGTQTVTNKNDPNDNKPLTGIFWKYVENGKNWYYNAIGLYYTDMALNYTDQPINGMENSFFAYGFNYGTVENVNYSNN